MITISKIMAFAALNMEMTDSFSDFLPKRKKSKGKKVEIRTEPKIGRNKICTKCESGLKFKNCCIKLN